MFNSWHFKAGLAGFSISLEGREVSTVLGKEAVVHQEGTEPRLPGRDDTWSVFWRMGTLAQVLHL